jgi:hypothetical protein
VFDHRFNGIPFLQLFFHFPFSIRCFLPSQIPGIHDFRFPVVLSSTVSLIRDHHFQAASSQLLDLSQSCRKGMSAVLIRLDIQRSYDNPTAFGPGNRHLVAKLILLVILAFGHTVHVGFMDAIDLVLAVPFLAQDLCKDLQFSPTGLKTFRWKLSLKLP